MLGFTLREIIFAAVMAAAMGVIGFIAVPLVSAIPVPGLRSLIVAPFYGVILGVALVRIPKVGMLTLISFFIGVVNSFIAPIMGVLFMACGIFTDLIAWLLFDRYRSSGAAIVCPGLYMMAMAPFSLLFGLMLARGTSLSAFLLNPLLVIGPALGSLLLGLAGGYLGSKMGRELNQIAVRR